MKKKYRKNKIRETKIRAIRYFPGGSFVVHIGDHLRFGIICGPIWGSFAVREHLRRCTVQISRGICTLEDRLSRFSRNAQATNLIQATKKILVVNTNFFSTFFLDRNLKVKNLN